jgi:hypothetical protein
MPTLDWIGKKAVVNHHREVPYRLGGGFRFCRLGVPCSMNTAMWRRT